jgi:hypothetical protein
VKEESRGWGGGEGGGEGERGETVEEEGGWKRREGGGLAAGFMVKKFQWVQIQMAETSLTKVHYVNHLQKAHSFLM